jgi:hypothetical protein
MSRRKKSATQKDFEVLANTRQGRTCRDEAERRQRFQEERDMASVAAFARRGAGEE